LPRSVAGMPGAVRSAGSTRAPARRRAAGRAPDGGPVSGR
jgi:hypothetical protein